MLKRTFIVSAIILSSMVSKAQNAPAVKEEKKPAIIPSACLPEQVCCYYNTHSSSGWELKCLSKEECEKLKGTVFSSDKCVQVQEENPPKKEAPKKPKY